MKKAAVFPEPIRQRGFMTGGELTSLGNCNQIVMGLDCGDGVRLDRSGILIIAEANVLTHDGVKASIVELGCQRDLVQGSDLHS